MDEAGLHVPRNKEHIRNKGPSERERPAFRSTTPSVRCEYRSPRCLSGLWLLGLHVGSGYIVIALGAPGIAGARWPTTSGKPTVPSEGEEEEEEQQQQQQGP